MSLRRVVLMLLLVLASTFTAVPATSAAGVTSFVGTLNGAPFLIQIPPNWNGTLILYSHGYQQPGQPLSGVDVGDPITGAWLLANGYAFAMSGFSATGWAVAEGLNDQIALLDYFEQNVAMPQQVVAAGVSMGGLITSALVDLYPDRFTAALPICSGFASSVGWWNEKLDSAFALKTLLAPSSNLQVVDIPIESASDNVNLAKQIVSDAQNTQIGKARLALVAALDNVPGWFDPTSPQPARQDYAAQEQNQFLWELNVDLSFQFAFRAELEQRAGGNPSWNTGVDYRVQLSRSDYLPEVVTLYREAGLDLNADLQTLNSAERIAADPAAVNYLSQNVTLDGQIHVPVLSLHTTADGLASVQSEQDLARVVAQSGSSSFLRQVIVQRAGHCTVTPAETIAAVKTLANRIDTGQWDDVNAHTLNTMANALGPQLNVLSVAGNLVPMSPAFEQYQPTRFLRPYDAPEY